MSDIRNKIVGLRSQLARELETCLQVLKEPVQGDDEKKPCYFAMYAAEKLETFDKRKRMIAENRI